MGCVNIEEHIFSSKQRPGEYLKYLSHMPDKNNKLPLIVQLHGAGGRGDDLSELYDDGAIGQLLLGRKLNANIVAPLCHCDTWFELYDLLIEFIDVMRHGDNVDEKRVYLCGASMGGYTAWQVAMSRPEWFAALVPICGGGMYWNAARLKDMPIWAFHGALDRTVLPEESLHMVYAVNSRGGNAKLTILPQVEHSAWIDAFGSDEMWEWMFAQSL